MRPLNRTIVWRDLPIPWNQGGALVRGAALPDPDPDWDANALLRSWVSDRTINLQDWQPTENDLLSAVRRLLERLRLNQGGGISRGPLVGTRDFVQIVLRLRTGQQNWRSRRSPLFHPGAAANAPYVIGAGQPWQNRVSELVNELNDEYELGDNLFNWFENEHEIAGLRLEVRVARAPLAGGSWKSITGGDGEDVRSQLVDVLKKKSSVILVQGEDELCLFRCVAVLICRAASDALRSYDVVAQPHRRPPVLLKRTPELIAFTDGPLQEYLRTRPQAPDTTTAAKVYKQCRDGRKVQGDVAKWLADQVGWNGAPTPTVAEIAALELLIGQRISVWDFDAGVTRAYHGHPDLDGPRFNVLLAHEHYYAVTSPQGFLEHSYWCDDCGKGFSNVYDHKRCPSRCGQCDRGPSNNDGALCETQVLRLEHSLPDKEFWQECDECHMRFATDDCMEAHAVARKQRDGGTYSRCDERRSCGPDCPPYNAAWYPERDTSLHQCGDSYCRPCETVLHPDEHHRCWMQTETLRKPSDKIIVFDFECEQSTGKHVVTHVGASYWTDEGEDIKTWEPADDGDFSDVAPQFYKWLFGGKAHKRGWVAIAHNGQ